MGRPYFLLTLLCHLIEFPLSEYTSQTRYADPSQSMTTISTTPPQSVYRMIYTFSRWYIPAI